MKKFFSYILLGGLFFLSISPDWSLLTIGEKIAQSDVATTLFQIIIVIVAIIACALVFFDLPFAGKKQKRFEE